MGLSAHVDELGVGQGVEEVDQLRDFLVTQGDRMRCDASRRPIRGEAGVTRATDEGPLAEHPDGRPAARTRQSTGRALPVDSPPEDEPSSEGDPPDDEPSSPPVLSLDDEPSSVLSLPSPVSDDEEEPSVSVSESVSPPPASKK